MFILNTTFHVPLRMKRQFVEWLKTEYSNSATKYGLIDAEIARVLGGEDEEGVSIAFRAKASTLSLAHKWNDGVGDELRRRLVSQYGSNVAFFTTFLAIEE